MTDAKDTLREKFDRWYASPRGEVRFKLRTHYLGWAFVCYAEGYKQAALDLGKSVESSSAPVARGQADGE